MKTTFNLTRYKELLKLEEEGDITFLDLELLSYEASIEEQISYDQKEEYFLLIEKYLNRIITPAEFRSKFLKIINDSSVKAGRILKDFKKLEVFSIAQDLTKFSDPIGSISTLCLEFDELWDGTMERMTEREFYSLVTNHYFQLRRAFPKS